MSRSAREMPLASRPGEWSLARYPIGIEPGWIRLASIAIPVDTSDPDALLPVFLHLVERVRLRPVRSVQEIRSADLQTLTRALTMGPSEVRHRLARLIEDAELTN